MVLSRDRIEIHAQFVGMLQIVGPHGMRMELETRQVRHPRERRCVAWHDFLRSPSRWERQRGDLDPVGT